MIDLVARWLLNVSDLLRVAQRKQINSILIVFGIVHSAESNQQRADFCECLSWVKNAHGKNSSSVVVYRVGWLRLVGSFKLQVSFAEYSLFCTALLQKRPYNFKEPTDRSHPICSIAIVLDSISSALTFENWYSPAYLQTCTPTLSTHLHTSTHTCTHLHTRAHIHTHVHTSTHTALTSEHFYQLCVGLGSCLATRCVYVCVCVCVWCVDLYQLYMEQDSCFRTRYVCACVCVSVCACFVVCVYMCIWTFQKWTRLLDLLYTQTSSSHKHTHHTHTKTHTHNHAHSTHVILSLVEQFKIHTQRTHTLTFSTHT